MRSRATCSLAGALLGVLLLAAPAAAATRVAIVVSSGSGPFVEAARAIRAALERQVQPEVLLFDLQGRRDETAGLRELLAGAEPSLIITVGSLATAAALAEPGQTPVVFSMVLYPQESGFLPAKTRPVTGVALDVPPGEQFATIRRLLPRARRLGVVHSTTETSRVVAAARAAAPAQGFDLVAETVEEPGQVPAATERLLESVDAMWMVADSKVMTPETTSALLLAAMRRRVPVFGLSAVHVQAGALAALSCDYADVGTQTGELALRVLGGANAASVPPATPRKLALALNLRTAEHMGLEIDRALVREAAVVVR